MVYERKIFLLLSFLLFVSLFTSCNKEGEVGLGVQPEGDQLNLLKMDVDGLTAYTIKEDSLISSSILSPLLLGSLNDVETGVTYASFYTQLRLSSSVTAATFNGATSPDSVVLTLGLLKDGLYGMSNQFHNISVYQLADTMSRYKTYYNVDSFALGNLMGQGRIIPDVTGLHSDEEFNVLQLRILLDTAFGGYLMRELTANTPSNDSLLKSIFKGIYITDVVDGNGSIVSINPSSALNRLTITYNDTSKFQMEINNTCVRSLRFQHNNYCTPISGVTPQVCYNDTAQGQITAYVQSLAGLKTKIKLPDLKQVFGTYNISINRADLIITLKQGTDDGVFKPHDNLLLLSMDTTGRYNVTSDFSTLGGNYSIADKQYKLNITRHLQQILNGNVKDNSLYIVAGGVLSALKIPTNARRTVLNGGSSMKISITYTQQNN